MAITQVPLKPSLGAIQVAALLGVATVLAAAVIVGVTDAGTRVGAGAVALLGAAATWAVARRVAGVVEVDRAGLTIRHAALYRPLRIAAAAITDVVAGDPLDLGQDADLPRPVPFGRYRRRHRTVPASLVVCFSEPIAIRPTRGERFTARSSLALVAADPEAAADALAAAGLPVRRVPRAATEVREQRARRRRGTLLAAVLTPALVVASIAVKTLILQPDAPAAPADDHGRAWLPGVPAVPGALHASATTLADGSVVYAWQTSPARLRLRIDTAPRRCGGAPWVDTWHASDFQELVLDGDGAFHRASSSSEAYDGGMDDVSMEVDGVVRATTITGRLQRTDAYRGMTSGTCARTLRFTVPRD